MPDRGSQGLATAFTLPTPSYASDRAVSSPRPVWCPCDCGSELCVSLCQSCLLGWTNQGSRAAERQEVPGSLEHGYTVILSQLNIFLLLSLMNAGMKQRLAFHLSQIKFIKGQALNDIIRCHLKCKALRMTKSFKAWLFDKRSLSQMEIHELFCSSVHWENLCLNINECWCIPQCTVCTSGVFCIKDEVGKFMFISPQAKAGNC